MVFQFPSNGKARVNQIHRFCCVPDRWFQFPSNGKARVNDALRKDAQQLAEIMRFNSLQTGKHV